MLAFAPRRPPPAQRPSRRRRRRERALGLRPPLVEDHEQRRQSFGVDQAEDLDVVTRTLAPAGDLEGALRLREQAVIADGPVVVLTGGLCRVETLFLEPLLADLGEVGVAGE